MSAIFDVFVVFVVVFVVTPRDVLIHHIIPHIQEPLLEANKRLATQISKLTAYMMKERAPYNAVSTSRRLYC